MNKVDAIAAKQIRNDIPEFRVGVTRIFPVNSPKIAKLTVIKKGKVRRAKLNFLKGYKGQYRMAERGQK